MPKEYIEREAVLNMLNRFFCALNGIDAQVLVSDIKHACLELLVADVVEVVRCKDCEKWNEKSGLCSRYSHNVENVRLLQYTRPTDFCSDAINRKDK